jgi:hypothetical protein
MYDIGVMGCTCRNVNIYLNYSGDDDVMAEEDKDSQHVNDLPTDTATTSKELIQNLALNIPSATQLIFVRRKFLWDDYVRQWMVVGLGGNSLLVNMAIVNMDS